MLAKTPESILQQLDWKIVRRLDGLLQGDYRSLFYGHGVDFSDLREYQPEDDVRYIDWNVTARLETPYVRQYREDREITAWFLLDLTPSVDFGTVNALKRNLLIDFVVVLARLLTRHGNRVGAILFSGEIDKIIPPLGGEIQVLRLINDVNNQPRSKRSSETDLTVLLERAGRLIQRRSLVFMVSDFFSLPGWDRPLRFMTQRHELLAIRLMDKIELELPDVGAVFLEDAETGEQLFVDTHNPGFRSRFSQAAERREYYLKTTFRSLGVDVMELFTDQDLVQKIIRFAVLRKRQKLYPSSSAKVNSHSLGLNLSQRADILTRAG
jgi:uncharacterized protein (DUF58 family)